MKNMPLYMLPKVGKNDPLYGVVSVLQAMAEGLETLGGLRANAPGSRALTLDDLTGTGLVAVDAAGSLYNPNRTVPALNTEVTRKATRTGTQVYWEISGSKAIGTYLMTGSDLPEGARMIWGMYRVRTAAASATNAAVLSLGIQTDDPEGMVAPIGLDDPTAPWEIGSYNCIPNRRDPAKDTVPTTAGGRKAVLTVAGEALTDCDILLIGEYLIV
jgi:hypothetical protein